MLVKKNQYLGNTSILLPFLSEMHKNMHASA